MSNFEDASLEKDIEIIRRFYSRLNQNDIEGVMELLDPNIFRNEFEGSPGAGVFRGLSEMRRHFVSGRSSWAEGACSPVEFFSNGNKFVVDVHVKVLLKNDPKWIDAHVADGFVVQDGRVTEFHSFMAKPKAFEWAGIS